LTGLLVLAEHPISLSRLDLEPSDPDSAFWWHRDLSTVDGCLITNIGTARESLDLLSWVLSEDGNSILTTGYPSVLIAQWSVAAGSLANRARVAVDHTDWWVGLKISRKGPPDPALCVSAAEQELQQMLATPE
jgi:hypothetical protein